MTTRWVSLKQLREQLPLGVATVDRLRTEGVFRPGQEYIRKGVQPKSPLLFDLAACEAALRQLAATPPAETYRSDL